MKIALVCDWLTNVGGAEKVLLELHHLYPKAPIYTSQYNPKKIDWFRDADVRTGWLKIFPSFMRKFLGPLRQMWFSHLNLSEYDLVISVTGAEAKAVKAPNGVHISYCHVPTQYYWQMYDEYVGNPGFGILNPVVRFFFKLLVKPLRKKDFEAAQKVDYFVTISEYARELIAKYYKREAVVIHPPVEVKIFSQCVETKDAAFHSRPRPSGPSPWADGAISRAAALRNTASLECSHLLANDWYICTSRQVNWKRLDLAVKACLKLGKKLLVVGEGPEHKNLVRLAGDSGLIEFLPLQKKEELAELLTEAKGYIFPSMEPFGIAPVEALAAGCPVIAFGEGGVLDYVQDGKNGILFEKQSVKSLCEALEKFEKKKFNRAEVSRSVSDFAAKRFDTEIRKFINEKSKNH